VAENMAFHQNLRLFFGAYRQEVRFVFWFLVILTALNITYYLFARTSVEDFILSVMTARPPAFIINFLTPGEHVVVNGNQLASHHINFSVVSGCEGMGGMLLIISAVCAANVRLKSKLKGLVYGMTFIYFLNIFRIVGLYYVMRYWDRAFNFAHFFVGQTIIIFLGCAFFVLWLSRHLGEDERNAAS
jgi:exosortase family protein XrtM